MAWKRLILIQNRIYGIFNTVLVGIGGHKIRNGSAQFVIGGALAIQGSDLAGNAPARIVVPDIVGIQTIRDSISLDAEAGE